MRTVVALLAAACLALATGCGGGGAEPGAPSGATLVLDFQPNAVHAGIYAALERGLYGDAGVSLDVREPSASTDAPKLLEAGRAQFAVMDIHDVGIARERGLDVVAVAAIVERPLAAVIARGDVARPRDLEGRTVGVTGLPSDDAVLDSVLGADGADPGAVHRVTIGFNAVASLAAGRVDAATGFWNAEGVALRRQGVATREFRVDANGAPRYPELVLVTSRALTRDDPGLVRSVVEATRRGYELAIHNPEAALGNLLGAVPSLDPGEQRAELRALTAAHAFEPATGGAGTLDADAIRAWLRWDLAHGLLDPGADRAAFEHRILGGFDSGVEVG
jgi:NitT/TauT family transport system substrate-binding protein/putative hydroxymethylpyrimidine transport system substrate-binding protein